MENFIKLESRFSLISDQYLYVDTPDYLADQLFINEKLSVNFKEEYRKDNCDYVLIFCKVRKKDKEKFLRAMEKLHSKVILFGHNDYDKFCKELWIKLDEVSSSPSEKLKNSHDPAVIVNGKLVH